MPTALIPIQPSPVPNPTTLCPPHLGTTWDHVWLPAFQKYAAQPVKSIPGTGGDALASATGTTIRTDANGRAYWDKTSGAQALTAASITATDWTALYVGQVWNNASRFLQLPGLAVQYANGAVSVWGTSSTVVPGTAALAQKPCALVLRRTGTTLRAWLDGTSLGSTTVTVGTQTGLTLGSNVATPPAGSIERVWDVRFTGAALTDAQCAAASADAARWYLTGS